MKIMLYELKKIFNIKFFFFVCALFIVNICRLILMLDYDPNLAERMSIRQDKEYREFTTAIFGEINNDTAQRVVDGEQSFSNFIINNGEYNKTDEFYYMVYGLYKYQYEYASYSSDIVSRAEDNILFYEELDNTEKVKENQKICGIYGGRSIASFYDSEDFEWLFGYDFSTLILLIFAFVLSIYFFRNEKVNNTYNLLYMSGHGIYIFITKLLVTVGLTFFMGTALYISDYVVTAVRLNLNGALNPVYSISSYAGCPLNISIIGYYILICLIRIFECYVFETLFILIMELFNRNILSVFVGIISFVFSVIFLENIFKPDLYLKEFNAIYLFGRIYNKYFVMIAVSVMVFVVAMVFNYIGFKRRGEVY